MSEHLSQIQLAGYGRRTLDADELLVVDRHLASCNDCYQRFTSILSSAGGQARSSHNLSTESIEEPFHLDYDQHLVAYVDGTANDIDREIVESHVALCTECAKDLQDLQEFRRQPVQATAVRRSPRKPWMIQWQWPRVWNPQLTAVLIIGVLILGMTIAVFLWTTYRMPSPVQQAGNTPTPEANKQIPGDNKESLSPSGPVANPDKVAAQPSPQQKDDKANQQSTQGPLIALNDGMGQVTLDQNGHLTGLQTLPPDLRKNIASVLVTRELQVTPALADLSPGSSGLRGGGSGQSLLMPLEPTGIVIESDQPTFRWRAFPGGSDYVVTIYDSRLRSVQNSGPLAGTEWTATSPLQRGVTYSWQISAMKDGRKVVSPKPPMPEARFRVLDRNAVNALKDAKRLHGNSHLAMGVLYWKYGLIDEAERELEALVRANPESTVAKELLTKLRSLRRR
jgi:hypothetical protein